MAEQEHEFFGVVAGGGFPKWHCPGVPGCIAIDHEILMTPGQLQQWPYEDHAYSFEGDANHKEGNQRGGCWLLGSSSLALGAILTENLGLLVHARPLGSFSSVFFAPK